MADVKGVRTTGNSKGSHSHAKRKQPADDAVRDVHGAAGGPGQTVDDLNVPTPTCEVENPQIREAEEQAAAEREAEEKAETPSE